VNAVTKDLARTSASVVRDSISRAQQVDVTGVPRSPSGRVRAGLHIATTIGLAIAVFALAFKWSEERDLRRQAEAQVRSMMVARAPSIAIEQQHAAQAFGAAPAARLSPAANSAANSADLTAAGAPSTVRDRGIQQQLLRQLSEPTLRNAVRGQQRSAVLQTYGDLLRSWHLPTDKGESVLDLLTEQQLREMERSLAASDTSRQGTTSQPGDAQPGVQSDATIDSLKALLTDAQRAQLSQQQATLGERTAVSSLADELSLAQMPLTDSQQQQLIQMMYDERTAIPVPNVDTASANSPDAQRALDDWQSALDQRVQDGAASILTDDQQTRFEQFMTRQHEARTAFALFAIAQAGDTSPSTAPPATSSP
jgi:hypothetical protein